MPRRPRSSKEHRHDRGQAQEVLAKAHSSTSSNAIFKIVFTAAVFSPGYLTLFISEGSYGCPIRLRTSPTTGITNTDSMLDLAVDSTTLSTLPTHWGLSRPSSFIFMYVPH